MKSASTGLNTQLSSQVTTLATCWKVTRLDTSIMGFTDHDKDIVIDSITYHASTGYQRSALQTSSGLNVDNINLDSMLDAAAITEADIRNGKYDFAAVEIFLVNWANLADGTLKLRRGTMGEVSLKEFGFEAELRGMTQSYTRRIVELYTPDCRADLGDAQCKINLAAITESGVVSSQAIPIPTPTGTGGGGTGTGGGGVQPPITGIPVDGTGIAQIGTHTTLNDEIGNNTSSSSNYNHGTLPANFTGTTHIIGSNVTVDTSKMDDSQNPSMPGITSTNGNGNVSKLHVKTLLPGFTGRALIHTMNWFTGSAGSHINNGLNCNTTANVNNVLNDQISRGFDGMIQVWYSPTHISNLCLLKIQSNLAARANNTFTFMAIIEHLYIKASANPQQTLIDYINYVADTYFADPHYEKYNGRPILGFFGIELVSGINWTTVKASVRGNPLFIQRNSGGYDSTKYNGTSEGAFSWCEPFSSSKPISSTDPYSLAYLKDFYSHSFANPSKLTFGSVYPGFNGTLTKDLAWSDRRNIERHDGNCWLATHSLINSLWTAAGRHLPYVQYVTWDDYEEGTPLQLGIDNYAAITASISGNVVSWSVSGGEGGYATINHYTILIGTDGTNFTVAANVMEGAPSRSFDLSTIPGLVAGAYKVRVKAVGRASIRNHISSELSWTSVVSTTAGGQYYVATTGSDSNPGTQASPFKTIQFASTKAVAGDTILVADGTYSGKVLTQSSGVSGKPITYKSINKWGAHIQGVTGTDRVWHNTGNWVNIVGFEVTGTTGNNLGIINEGSNVRVLRNHVHDIPTVFSSNGGAGIDHGNYLSVNNDTIGNWVHNIGVDAPGANSAVHGIYHAMQGGIIASNLIYHVPGYGIQLWHAANAVTVANNTCFNCSSGILIGTGDSPGGIIIDNCLIVNNISRNNVHWGIVEDWTGTGHIGPNNQYLNNQVFGNPTGGIDNQVSTHVSGTLTTDPLMVNWQLDGSGDYHLQSGSPCRDTGTTTGAAGTDLDGGLRPIGSAYDRGAYEFGSTPVYP